MTGQSYDVQWGRVKDVSSADVIASGTEEEMKELLLQRSKPETAVARQPKEQQPVTQTVPASKSTQQPSKETVPASKKRRQQQPKVVYKRYMLIFDTRKKRNTRPASVTK